MEINKYLRKEKINKKGLAPIRISVIPFKTRIWIESGEKVRPKGWDSTKQRVRGTEPYYTQINERLQEFEFAAHEVYREALKEKRLMPPDEFRKAVIQKVKGELADIESKPKPSFGLTQVLEKWVNERCTTVSERSQKKLAGATKRIYIALLTRIKHFESLQKKPLSFDKMDMEFYQALKHHMLVDLKQSGNTFSSYMKRFKAFLDYCVLENIPVNPKYRSFSTPLEYGDVDSLTQQELKALQNVDFASDKVLHIVNGISGIDYSSLTLQEKLERLEEMRDTFLMMCYTGLRVSDVTRLSEEHIKGDLIVIKTQKTGVTCYIPYYDDNIFHPISLVEKYKGKYKTCLPVRSNINNHLKHLQKLIDFTRFKLTTKNARKTFVTLKLYQGLPARMIMQATGHKTESSFNHYAGINTQELISNFQKYSAGVK